MAKGKMQMAKGIRAKRGNGEGKMARGKWQRGK
jgi:hypothetical protein